MIEEKALAIKWCNDVLNDYGKYTLSPFGFQYILWNSSKEYQTQSFDWVTLNVHLKASLNNQLFTDQFINMIESVQTYADMLKLIKVEDELYEFQQFMKIVPFQRVTKRG